MLLQNLRRALSEVKSLDPAGDTIDVQGVLHPLQRRIDGLVARNPEVIKEVESQKRVGLGLGARDTVDKLYRDRFEALPERFLK